MTNVWENNLQEEEICTLKNVFLKGHIFQEYALLNLEQEYEHDINADIQTTFVITLPYRAVVRRMIVVAGDEVIVKGHIVSQMELEQELKQIEEDRNTSVTMRSLFRGIYAITIDPLPPCTKIKISVECYVELESQHPFSEKGERVRLVFPSAATNMYRSLMPHVEEWDVVPYCFQAELELEGAERIDRVSSPTHMICSESRSMVVCITADCSEMTRDFVLDICYLSEGKNKVYVVRDKSGAGGLAFYSLLAPLKQLPDREIKRCCILLDKSGNLLGSRLERAKNTIVEFLKQLPEEMLVQVAVFSEKFYYFAEQDVRISEKVIEEIRGWLNNVVVQNGYTVAEALTFFSDLEEDEAGVMISSGTALGSVHVIRRAEELLNGKPVCFVITDGKSEPSILPRLGEFTGGVIRSFPEDSAVEKAWEIRERLFVPSLKNVSIVPSGGIFDEIIPPVFSQLRLYERVNFVARFFGNVPVEISLSANAGFYQAKLFTDEIKEYENFDLLSLAYGTLRLNHLYDVLFRSPEMVWGKIREEIIKTAVEYRLLCNDTAMLCVLPTERSASVPLIRADVPVLKNRLFSEFAKDISVLRSIEERKVVVLTATQHLHLLYTMLYAQCEDGSFADFDSFDFDGRLETTALCLAALCREEKYHILVCRSTEYLLNQLEKGENLTPVILFALARAGEYLNQRGIMTERLQTFLEHEKASAAIYARADAEIPACTIRGAASSAARILIVRNQ